MAICEKCIHSPVCKYGENRSNGMYCTGEKCKQFLSIEDVVPRSEVEEIFEDLATIFKKLEKSYKYEICELLFEDLGTGIAELKKKYIGEHKNG